jgi:hypothetical protein
MGRNFAMLRFILVGFAVSLFLWGTVTSADDEAPSVTLTASITQTGPVDSDDNVISPVKIREDAVDSVTWRCLSAGYG